jgi:hypothetical protein
MTQILKLEKLESKDPKVKYGFAKELIIIAESNPSLLYKFFDTWINLINSDNNIIKWTATDILGYISSVDKDKRISTQIDNLFRILHSGKLITCNHAIFALGLIAKNDPNQRSRILKELITISNDHFETEECKAIATGKVIETMKPFLSEITGDNNIFKFVKIAQSSQRNATKKKAYQLMKKLKK